MSKALEDLAKQFQRWRSSPNKGRYTPPELIAGVARVLKTERVSVVSRRLSIGYSVIKQAQGLKDSENVAPKRTAKSKQQEQFIDLTQLVDEEHQAPNRGQSGSGDDSLIKARMDFGGSSCLHLQLTPCQLMQVIGLGRDDR